MVVSQVLLSLRRAVSTASGARWRYQLTGGVHPVQSCTKPATEMWQKQKAL